jgi:hypothetical protein
MGRNVPVDPYIRQNWASVIVKYQTHEVTDTFIKDLEDWCTVAVPSRYALEYCFMGWGYKGFIFYFKDSTDALLFKVSW